MMAHGVTSGGAATGRLHLVWINHFAVPPDQGGGTRHFEIGRELVRRGWRVTVVASDFNLHSRQYTRRIDGRDRSVIRESIDGVEFLWLWASEYHGNNWRRARNWLSFARRAARIELSERPTVIVGSSPHLFAALAAERLGVRLGVPFVFEVRDLWPESLIAAGGRRGATYYVFDRVARYLYARAVKIIVLARGSEAHLVGLGVPRERIAFVPNGTDVDAFERADVAVRNQGTPKLSADRLTFVYAGAHGPANGLDVLLEAASQLRNDERIRFLLLGDGPDKAALIADAQARGLPNVDFVSPVPKAEMPALLCRANAGLMVLRDSPLFAVGVSPNKLFDYMAAGLPIVCNVPGEMASLVAQSRSGEQASDGSASGLAEAVRRVTDLSEAERAALGANGRAWVTREHSRPRLAERLEQVLTSVTSSGNPR
jgi:glycosyltransferase involved in cell wall biosynthesis